MLNLETIAVKAVTEIVTKSFNAVAAGATSAIKIAWQKVFQDFASYMKETFDRNRFVRILSQKGRDEYIYNVYVSSSFKCGNKTISDEKLIREINDGKNVVVVGNGGAGKTFFMRHLWLTLFSENQGGRIPIFIELRKLNDLDKADLRDFVRLTISRRKLDAGVFDSLCITGRFVFILDGFDEVIGTHKDDLQRQILEMTCEFPDCRFVVSSRYEDHFAGWQDFFVYESCPFSFKQVKQLIKKVPFAPASKKLFVKELTERFFKEHVDFLSNPLLAIMMMMTFRENLEIPKRMNIFYDQAFNTLYHWHDSTKAYRRHKFLDIQDFQRSFSYFCLITYYDEKYEFTKTEMMTFIEKSSRLAGLEASASNILTDYQEAVNLIKQEGLVYSFIHRSFQEYFAANALVRLISREKFQEIVPRIAGRRSDNVMIMAFEMDRSKVVLSYIKPSLDRLSARGLLDADIEPLKALSNVSTQYRLHGHKPSSAEKLSFSMSISYDEEVRNFIALSHQIQRGREASNFAPDFDILFTPTLFDDIQPNGEAWELDGDVPVTVVVRNDSFQVLAGSSPSPLVDAYVKFLVEDQQDKITIQLTLIGQTFARVLRGLHAYWLAEIEKTAAQTRTLDEILGL